MLLRSADVLDIYVEPFIHSGFRLPNQPYSYYYRSLFFLHNETLSVWIHLLGTFILIGQVYQHILQISSILRYYLIYNCFGACAMLLCSAQAHLLHSRTLADHIRSFYLDYFGINFYGFTSGMILEKFSHQPKFFVNTTSINEKNLSINNWSYTILLTLFSLYSLSIACFCKTFYRRPYPLSHKILQCSGVLVVYLLQIIPVLKNLCVILISNGNLHLTSSEEKALFWHSMQIISFLLSGFVFVGRIPERFCPGLFDLFGQSHHTFHLTIFLMAFCQANAVYEDMRSISSIPSKSSLIIDCLSTFVVLLLQLISVFCWYRLSRPTIERRYQNVSKEKKFS